MNQITRLKKKRMPAGLSEDTPITRDILLSLGFEPPDHPDKWLLPNLMERDDIILWDSTMHDDGWISWALDQGSLEVRFHTLGDLDKFFIGCQRPSVFDLSSCGG